MGYGYTNYVEQWVIEMTKYTLEGMIEFDEGYFTVESSEVEKVKEKQVEVPQVNN